MKRQRLSLLLGALGLLAAPAVSQLQPMQTDGGRVVIEFLEGALEQSGLQLLELQQTAEVFDAQTELMAGELLAFGIRDESDLLALRNGEGNFQPYGVLGGSVRVEGGFYLYSPATGLGVDFHGFEIKPRAVRNDGPAGEPDPDYFFMSTAADPDVDDFQLCYVKILFAFEEGYDPVDAGDPQGGHSHGAPQLLVKAWDLIVTEALGQKLGRPDLVGRNLATGKIQADVSEFGGDWQLPPGQNIRTPWQDQPAAPPAAGGAEGTFKDVSLGILSSITQVGHNGTFPNGRAGLSMATTSCNLGDVNVPWLAPMQEDHPGISMALYRDMDGRLEQVGLSWIKNGFFALSNSQCIPCQNPSNGTFLGVGCSDTYGTGNNSDTFWLGAREEWDPFAATWECLGSTFDGTPADCNRSYFGGGVGSVNRRVDCNDSDLNNPGATYRYEAYYLVRGDQNLINNIGHRGCTMSWTGSAWSFQTQGGLVEGPLINTWGDSRSQVGLKPFDGDVIVAVDVTELSPTTWRYEYALFNFNLNREISSFSIPVKNNPADIYFKDIDNDPSNDWTVDTSANKITWTFPDVFPGISKEAGPLGWHKLYNFGFTTYRGPADRAAAMAIYKDGPGGDLLGAPITGPDFLGLTASKLSPTVNENLTITVQGGTDTMLVAVLSLDGVPVPPEIISPAVPFVNGEASFNVTIPPDVGGLTFTIIGADVNGGNLQVIDLTNLQDIAIQ